MKRKTFATALLAFVLSTFLAAFSAFYTPLSDGYKVGDIARDFSLKNVDGNMVSLADYKDAKGFIVVFTCNHCPYAKYYEARIMALDEMYAEKGYPVIAINPNDPKKVPEDSFENMQARAEEKGYSFPYLMDETQEIARTYGAQKTPHIYLLEKTKPGLKVRYIGAIDNNPQDAAAADTHYVQDAVNALLNGKEVMKTSAKAIGCTIKWKNS